MIRAVTFSLLILKHDSEALLSLWLKLYTESETLRKLILDLNWSPFDLIRIISGSDWPWPLTLHLFLVQQWPVYARSPWTESAGPGHEGPTPVRLLRQSRWFYFPNLYFKVTTRVVYTIKVVCATKITMWTSYSKFIHNYPCIDWQKVINAPGIYLYSIIYAMLQDSNYRNVSKLSKLISLSCYLHLLQDKQNLWY